METYRSHRDPGTWLLHFRIAGRWRQGNRLSLLSVCKGLFVGFFLVSI